MTCQRCIELNWAGATCGWCGSVTEFPKTVKAESPEICQPAQDSLTAAGRRRKERRQGKTLAEIRADAAARKEYAESVRLTKRRVSSRLVG